MKNPEHRPTHPAVKALMAAWQATGDALGNFHAAQFLEALREEGFDVVRVDQVVASACFPLNLEHRGYRADDLLFDADALLYSGVIYPDRRDVIHFSGRTLDELTQAFRASVDEYLAFRDERAGSPSTDGSVPTGC
jgi:hypothetical protein